MKFLVLIPFIFMTSQKYTITDFKDANEKWTVVNDGVMGGVSTSSFLINDGIASFRGEVSLENNGGFASVRKKLTSAYSNEVLKVIIRVKGDGKTYKFRIRTNDNFDGISYSQSFKTSEGKEWEEISLYLNRFTPTFRGNPVPNAKPLRPEQMSQIGFLIGNKKQESFQLLIDWIKIE